MVHVTVEQAAPKAGAAPAAAPHVIAAEASGTDVLSEVQVQQVVDRTLARADLSDGRLLVIVPDGTRSGPVAAMLAAVRRAVAGRVERLDVLIALGTHAPMNAGPIARLVGGSPAALGMRVINHAWDDPATFVEVGTLTDDRLREISEGRLRGGLPVRVNRLVTEYATVLICGPVFPHEVVGFSGGNKYLFPGVSGPEVIDTSHWLGALITSQDIIGTLGITPVRRLIDAAAALVPGHRLCLAMVVTPQDHGGLRGLFGGTPQDAWAQAAQLSSRTHIRWLDRPVRQVLSVMSDRYADIWTAAKGMYKAEPVVADGGEVIVYAPRITQFSETHGDLLARVGYHCRDYFLAQPDRFAGIPGGVLAHSTHLRGAGTYDTEHGERPRIHVTLATGISEERCRAHNLGYRDPATIDPDDRARRAEHDPELLVIPDAGETLFRLREPQT